MQERARFAVLLVLAVSTAAIWYALASEDRSQKLTLTFFDVGQGDAILIDAPSGRQVLIDGGPDSGILRELSSQVPWYDRTIDLMIATHPDADHIGGLNDVLDRYHVDTIIISPVGGDTELAASFLKKVEAERSIVHIADRGDIVDIGGGAYIEILFPDRELRTGDTNVACVVTRVVYGETSALLPCDAPQSVEKYISALDGKKLHSDILKAGHHGSRTSSSEMFIGLVSPAHAVLSRGCNNRYGHPHQEVIDVLNKFETEIFDTCEDGSIRFVSDGSTVLRK